MRSIRALSLALPPAFVVVAGLAAPAAHAERKVDFHEAAKPGGRVIVSLVGGDLQIETWSKNEVSATGVVGDDVEEVSVSRSDDEVRIQVRIRDGRGTKDGDARLLIKVPAPSDIDATSVSAPVFLRGELGRVKVGTVSGDVVVSASTQELDVKGVDAAIEVKGASSRLTLATVSGPITAKAARGELEAESVSGDTSIGGGPFRRVEISSISGRIELTGALNAQGPFRLKSQSGAIRLRVPRGQAARYKLKSFSGKVENRAGGGDKGPEVEVTSFSGRITVEPEPA